MSRKTTLAEMMGSKASSANGKLSLAQLPEILGDATPDLPKNAVGRHRLVRALKQRFGANFRSLPGVGDLVTEFDSHVALEVQIAKIKAIKPGGTRG